MLFHPTGVAVAEVGEIPRGLRQPDGVTCGATCVAAARARHDRSFAAALRTDPAAMIRAEHRELAGWRGRDGGVRLPWPRALGSSPWAVADALADAGGEPHTVRALPRDPVAAFDRIAAQQHSLQPSALYVGSRLLPRHVTLVLPHARVHGRTLAIFEPASGRVLRVGRDDVAADPRLAGWPRWWLLVSPARRSGRRTRA